MNCPCGSGKTYEDCCKPLHTRKKHAPTPEALMRSRFSDFAIPNGEYLMETTFPPKRKFHNIKDLQEWGEINTWTLLEIIKTTSADQVEFKAYYTNKDGRKQVHHEHSLSKKMNGKWYYVSDKFLD